MGFRFPLNSPYKLSGAFDTAYDESKDMDYELVEVAGDNEWRDYHAIRREVLWEARRRTGYNDKHSDDYVSANRPLLLKADGRAIGTTRLDDLGNGTGARCGWWRSAPIFRGEGWPKAGRIGGSVRAKPRYDEIVRKRRPGSCWLLREAWMAAL